MWIRTMVRTLLCLVVCVRYQVSNFLSYSQKPLHCFRKCGVAPTLGSLWCDKYSDDLKPVAVTAWNRLRSLTHAVCSTSQRQRPGSCESVVCSRRAGCCRRMKTRSCSRTAFILRAACKSNRVCSCKACQASSWFLRMFLWLSVVAAEVLRFRCCIGRVYVYTSLELEL